MLKKSQITKYSVVGLKRLVLLIGPLYLIDMWFGEDQRANMLKTQVQKRLDYIFKISITTLHSIVNTIGRPTYPIEKPTNMHFH